MKLFKQEPDEVIQATVEIMSKLDKSTRNMIFGYADYEYYKYEQKKQAKNYHLQIITGDEK